MPYHWIVAKAPPKTAIRSTTKASTRHVSRVRGVCWARFSRRDSRAGGLTGVDAAAEGEAVVKPAGSSTSWVALARPLASPATAPEAATATPPSSTTSTTTAVMLSRPPPWLARRTSSAAASSGSWSRRRTLLI